MTSAELRRIVEAMTERPLRWTDRDDLRTLTNHANAFVALVEAVERWRHTRASDTRALMDAVRAVDAALATVHAVRSAP